MMKRARDLEAVQGHSRPAWGRKRSLRATAVVGAILVLSACGGTQPAPAEPPTAEPPPAAPTTSGESAAGEPAAGAATTWAEMTGKQKGQLMDEVVMPRMAQLFKEADPKEFAEMDCGTCHGKDAKARGFEMPNPDLHKLTTTDNFAHELKDHPDMTKFMMKIVLPEMVKMLPGVQPMDPATGKGFGCFNCHTGRG